MCVCVCVCVSRQRRRTQDFAGVGVQPEDGHGEGDAQADVVAGVLQGGPLRQDQVDPHGLDVWGGAGQLGDEQALQALGGLVGQGPKFESGQAIVLIFNLPNGQNYHIGWWQVFTLHPGHGFTNETANTKGVGRRSLRLKDVYVP